MTQFKSLFSFLQNEISCAFKQAQLLCKVNGLKLLSSPLQPNHTHGKLLIITPRAVGKAHQRNLIKRQLKALYYENQLYLIPKICIILIYKEGTLYSFEELKQFLLSIKT